jgi:hypothetical protein
MPWASKLSRSSDPDAEPVVYDDGGSGLLEACESRFSSRNCDIACDARHTVWVKRADGSRSVGLSPWMLGRQSMDELLDGVEARLGRQPVAAGQSTVRPA